tara:strand:+ start:3575 stop:4114 length:540 start_codon:yes stop_codon:yes gene_type:complete
MITNKITNDISNISTEEKKSKKTDNCQELKNIAYKTMLLNGTDINPKYDKYNNSFKISNYLDDESIANKKESWSKLDKTQKIKHLYNYTEILKENDELSEEEVEDLKKYLVRCLDRKCLMKTKEVLYDKDNNKILSIPYLIFNQEDRNYILRKDDKHVSTIKSLPSDKRGKAKTIKIHE